MIIADSREPQYILKRMQKRFGNEFKIETLAWGDYLIVGDRFKVVIERKSVFDLIASVNDKRLWKQLDGIRVYGDDWYAVLLIEGSKWRVIKSGRVTYPRWIGIISSIMTMPRIKMVYVDDSDELIDLISNLNKRAGKPPKEISFSHIKKEGRSKEDEIRDILISFSGVGVVSAKRMINEEKSLYRLFRMTKKKIIEKYGKIGEHIYDIIHYEVNKDENEG